MKVKRQVGLGILTIVLSGLYLACHSAHEEKGAKGILKSKQGGDFRGNNLGDNVSKVESNENNNIVYSMPDELVYRIAPNVEDSTWYEISYNFHENGLYYISLQVFPKNDTYLKLYKDDFVKYYKEKYGDCKYKNGYCEWRTLTESGHLVNISLTDSIPTDSRPCIKITFNETEPLP